MQRLSLLQFVAVVQAIFDRMRAAAKPLGDKLIGQEQVLDQLFAKGDITPDRLAAATAAIAELQGRLRSVHLSAHLETRALLNADQIGRYRLLRGYSDQQAPAQRPHHGYGSLYNIPYSDFLPFS